MRLHLKLVPLTRLLMLEHPEHLPHQKPPRLRLKLWQCPARMQPLSNGASSITSWAGLKLLTDALQDAFPGARAVRGDRLASVATGLGLYAKRLFTA